MNTRLPPLLAASLALLLSASARAAEESTTIKFSDPAKPGVIRINPGRNDVTVEGVDAPDVTVKSDIKAISNRRTKDGLRVLSSASGFGLAEKDNVLVLDAVSMDGGGKGGGNFRISVPRNTNVVVQNVWGGDITCTGIAGDIEIDGVGHGDIRLTEVSGGVVASTMNGAIRANIRDLKEGKPLSFTSMNGEIVVRVPEAAKANVRLRTQNGSVLTDFEETALVTKAETVSGPSRARTLSRAGGKVLTSEVEEAIREATRLSAGAVAEALEAVKQGLEEAKLNSEEARRAVDDAKRQIEQARRQMDRARVEAGRRSEAPVPTPQPPAAPAPAASPRPPKPPIITITGGKLVTGTLNGGGAEISVSTMNGDVILRKLE